MKDFELRVRQLTRDRKMHNRWIAFMLVFSMIVSFMVPYASVIPAAAWETQGVELKNGNGISVNMAISDSDGNTIYNDYEGGGGLNTSYKASKSPILLDFTFDYTIDNTSNITAQGSKNGNDQAHMYIDLTSLVNLNGGSLTELSSEVIDSAYSSTKSAGEFNVRSDGYILVRLYDDYINNYLKSNSAKGLLSFSGELGKSASDTGDQTFNILGHDITVDFPEPNLPSIGNKQYYIPDGSSDIVWTINIANNDSLNLNGYKLEDSMFSIAKDIEVSPSDMTFNKDGNIWTINSNSNSTSYNITYKTSITNEDIKNGKVDNNVYLKKPDSDTSISNKLATAYFSGAFTFTKSCSQDYSVGEGYNGNILWEISVNNKYGSLDGYIIEDDKIPDSVSIDNGTITKLGDGKWRINTSEKNVKITYRTSAEPGSKTSNKARLEYPDGTDTEQEAKKDITYQKEADFYTLTKTGVADQDNKRIKWTVSVDTLNKPVTLKNYKLTDSQFPSSVSDLEFETCKYQWTDKNPSDVISLSNGELVFTQDLDNVRFSYYTDVADPGNDETFKVSNTISDNKHSDSTTASVDYQFRNSLSKTRTSSNPSLVATKGEITQVLGWKASITLDRDISGKVYKDILSSVGEGASHTMTDSQFSAIKLYSQGTELVNGTDYTITKGDNGFEISFLDPANKYTYVDIEYNTTAVVGKDAVYGSYNFENTGEFNGKSASGNTYGVTKSNPEINERKNLSISKYWHYAGGVESKLQSVTYELQYKIGYNGEWKSLKKAEGKNYVFESDPEYNDSSSSVFEVRLVPENKTDYSNSNFIKWSSEFEDLPGRIANINDDGSQGKIDEYYYRVVETKVNDIPISDGHYIIDEGTFITQYDDTDTNIKSSSGTGTNEEIAITNQFHSNVNISLNKSWSGISDADKSAKFKLQYNTTGQDRGWLDVQKGSTGEIIYPNDENYKNSPEESDLLIIELSGASGWSYSFNNLKRLDVTSEPPVYYSYRVIEIECNGKSIIDNKSVVDDEHYYEISYNYANGNSGVITYSTSVNVVNEYKEIEKISLNIKKSWDDQAWKFNGDTIPEHPSIKAVLQSRVSGETVWKDVQEVELTATNFWTYSLSDLPEYVIENDTLKLIEYGIRESSCNFGGTDVFVGKGETSVKLPNSADKVCKISYSSVDSDLIITNTLDKVEYTDLSLFKKWYDDADNSANRPDSIIVEVQRRLANSSDEWETFGDRIEIGSSVQSTGSDQRDGNGIVHSYVEWTGPRLSVPKEYEYRIVEVAYKKKSVEYSLDGLTEFECGDGTYSISYSYNLNNSNYYYVFNNYSSNTGLKKYAVDSSGNKISAIEADDLDRYLQNIDGEDYYVFNWKLPLQGKMSSNNDLVSFIDELPEGFTLCEKKYANIYGAPKGVLVGNSDNKEGYYPTPNWMFIIEGGAVDSGNSIIYQNFDSYDENVRKTKLGINVNSYPQPPYPDSDTIFNTMLTLTGANCYCVKNENGRNIVVFTKPMNNNEWGLKNYGAGYALYSTKIKKADLEAKMEGKKTFSISNEAAAYEISAEDGQPQKVGDTAVGTITINNTVKEKLISKGYETTIIPGIVKYSLDINPSGKNLSTGDTIDIKDIFDTSAYFDSDKDGGTNYSGNHLVDVLMNNIKIYSIDSFGNEELLNSNQYTINFDSGVSVSDGSALLELEIPDETHLRVVYEYELIANKNTPSVVNGCKSSTKVAGRYQIMQPGIVPPAGDKITFSNRAELQSDSATAVAERKNDQYEVHRAYGIISTVKLPQIVKVNVGDYTIDNLDSTFLLASYNTIDKKWYYAKSIASDGTISWLDEGADGSKISSGAMEVRVRDSYRVSLPLNTLYKLIEISVPEGYEGSNLGLTDIQFRDLVINYINNGQTSFNDVDYGYFLDKFVKPYYFTNNSEPAEYPNGLTKSDVMVIKSGEDIKIPNNELIDISCAKKWIQPLGGDAEVELGLYWSYTKSSKKIPADAKLVTARDLGLITPLDAIKTVTNANSDFNLLWQDVPNGIKGKPIYYYVKELSYTIGGVKYSYNEATNTFISMSGTGSYMPTYIGNATNKTSSITVSNSKSLLLKKVWKDMSGQITTSTLDNVKISIYGVDENGLQTEEALFSNVVVRKSENWVTTLDVPSDMDLSEYKTFVAEETGIDTTRFVVSCVFSINNNTGEITVTNKDTIQTSATVKVIKNWSDGEDIHDNDKIGVTLYRSTQSYSTITNSLIGTSGFDEVEDSSVELSSENNWSAVWRNLPLDDGEGNEYYYFALETDSSNVTAAGKYKVSYSSEVSGGYTNFKIENLRNSIMLKKIWKDSNNIEITDTSNLPEITINIIKEDTNEIADTVTLNNSNNWSYVYDVPSGDTYTGKYIIEEVSVPNHWTVSYLNNSQYSGGSIPLTAVNTRENVTTSISVEKEWQGDSSDQTLRDNIVLSLLRTNRKDANGNTISDESAYIWDECDYEMPIPTKNGNVWTYTYTGLEKYDSIDNEYYYKVYESDMEGYSATYPKSEIGGAKSGTLHITNLRNISLTIKKEWENVNPDDAENININIYRSTQQPTGTDISNVKLLLKLSSESVSVGKGKSIEVKSNNELVSANVIDTNIAEAVLSGDKKVLTITGKELGTTQIKISDGTEEKLIDVSVSALEIYLNGSKTALTVEAGSINTLSAKLNNSNVDATFVVTSSSDVITVNGSSATAVGLGEATIKAIYGYSEATVEVNVVCPSTFTVEGPDSVQIGKTITLHPVENYGTFRYSLSDDSDDGIVSVDANTGIVTGISNGEVIIVVTRTEDNIKCYHKVEVKNRISLSEVVNIGDLETNDKLIITFYKDPDANDQTSGSINLVSNGNAFKTFNYSTELFANGNSVSTQEMIIDRNYEDVKMTVTSWCYDVGNVVSIDYSIIKPIASTSESKIITESTVVSSEDVISSIHLKIVTDSSVQNCHLLNVGNASVYSYSDVNVYNSGYVVSNVYIENNSVFEFDMTIPNDVAKSLYIEFKNEHIENVTYSITTISYGSSPTPKSLPRRNIMMMTSEMTGSSSSKFSRSSALLRYSSMLSSALPDENAEIELVSTITISSTDGWQKELDLPAYDSEGREYYYWVVEDTTNLSGYKVAYEFDDNNENTFYCIDSSKSGASKITVHNIKKEDASVELPEAGGTGTAPYTVTGFLIITSGAVITVFKHRRRKKYV